jgi:hypothetical protein
MTQLGQHQIVRGISLFLPERLLPDGRGRQGYSLDQVRTILEKTKDKRDIAVEVYFPNRLL